MSYYDTAQKLQVCGAAWPNQGAGAVAEDLLMLPCCIVAHDYAKTALGLPATLHKYNAGRSRRIRRPVRMIWVHVCPLAIMLDDME